MKIGIDVSQLAYEGTGVAGYLERLLEYLLESDDENEYVLFFSGMRGKFQNSIRQLADKNYNSKVKIKKYPFPPTFLHLLWNILHIVSIERFIGNVDIFISSDWTQPPLKKAKGITILYDLIVYKYPEETDKKIVATQKQRLKWVKKECAKLICISEATKKDAMEILGLEENRLEVVYPGI